MRKLFLVFCLILAGGFLFAIGDKDKGGGGSTQAGPAFPTRPIEVTCLFGAGSAADTIARKFSDLAQTVLNQPLPVVNRTGGGQAIGYTHAKDQRPDGYNVVWTSNGMITAYYQGNIDFKQEAFRSIAQISYEPVCIAVKADAPWNTMEDFYRHIRANPGTIRIGNSGVGTYTHLVAAALENKAGSRIVHVPFGQGLAFASLMGGQIEASVQLPSEVMAQYESKELRILAVSSGERIASLPDTPTFKQSNIDLEMILWRGIAVPAGTPDDIVRILEGAARTVVTGNEFIDFCNAMSIIPAFKTGSEFDKFVDEDDKLIGDLMKLIGTSQR